jgi:acetyltransferase (GNAT) family protein
VCYDFAAREALSVNPGFRHFTTVFMSSRANLPVLSQDPAATPAVSPTRSQARTESKIEVKPCSSAARFLKVQNAFYQGDPNYAPPVVLLDRWRLTPWTSVFMKENQVALFLAWRDGKVVGRISATRNPAHDQVHGDRVGFFGHFEARDQAAAHALLEHACRWLREHGAETVRGPVDLSTNHRCGVLVGGDQEPPFPFMAYNAPHYRDYFESYGMEVVKRLLSIRLHGATLQLERLETFITKVSQRRKIHLKPVRSSEFRNDWDAIATLYNRIWAHNWGFAPMSGQDFKQEMAGFGLIAAPEFFQVCYAGEEPIGLALALPDINSGARACNGKMLPFGWWKFFRAVKRTGRFRLMMLGIVPEHWKTGADVVLTYQMIQGLLARGRDDCEAGWILEDNYLMIRMLERLGGKTSKHYSIYGMSL